jgi:hypothetical protein
MSKRTKVVAVFLVGCMMGAVAGGFAHEALAQSPAMAPARTRWVFLCEQGATGPEASAIMNKNGRDGWDFVGTGGENVWCFKKFATQR